MGYNLHITRREHWSDADPENEISLREWIEYVGDDEEMRLDHPGVGSSSTEEQIAMIEEGLAVWTAYSREGIDDNHAWFWYDEGNIVVKNPDAEIRGKMLEIADALDAVVQGDDGEFYGVEQSVNGEYTISKGWKIFMAIAGVSLIALFGYVLGMGFRSTQLWLQVFLIVTSAMSIVFFLYSMLESLTMKVSINDESISFRSVFYSRLILLEDIKGIRKGENEYRVVSSKVRQKSITVSKYFSHSSDIFTWLSRNFADIDEVEKAEEETRVLSNYEFGFTPAARETRLKRARRIARIVNIVGCGVAAWLIFKPVPYEVAIVVGIVMPMAALLSIYIADGLIRLDEKKNSPYPSIFFGFIAPAAAGTIRATYDFEILTFERAFTVSLIMSSMLTFFVLSRTKEVKFRDVGDYALSLLYVGMMTMYTYGFYVSVNCHFDHSTPTIFWSEVVSKEKSTGKITSYYVKVKPWGPRKQADRLSVTFGQYKSINPGDTVAIHLHEGLLKTPWCFVTN